MPDPRLPLKITQLPGGFTIEFADGRRPIMMWGREHSVASAAKALTIDEAKALAQEVARALTEACERRRLGVTTLARLRGLAGQQIVDNGHSRPSCCHHPWASLSDKGD